MNGGSTVFPSALNVADMRVVPDGLIAFTRMPLRASSSAIV